MRGKTKRGLMKLAVADQWARRACGRFSRVTHIAVWSSEIRSSHLIASRYKGWIGRVCEGSWESSSELVKAVWETLLMARWTNHIWGFGGCQDSRDCRFSNADFDCLLLGNRLSWVLVGNAPRRSDKSLTPFSIASYIADKSKSLLEIRFKSRFEVLHSQD